MAVFFALLQPGDTVMGMNLAHGGHLSHGSPANFSGAYFNIVPYGVNDQGVIDYDEVRRIAIECRPKLIVAGASAYARIIDFKRFREIADEVGAYLMVDIAHIAGLVAAGLHPSPIPYAHVTTTTTHKTLRGPRGGMILSDAEFASEHKLNKAIFPGTQGGPLMHVIAAKAVCFREALDPSFRVYAENIVKNSKALCSGLISRGIDTSAWDQTISSLRKEGKRVLLFTEDDRIIGVIAAIRPLIPGAHEAVRALKRMDIDICLLTDGSQDESDLLSKNLRLENVIYQPARYEVERLLQNLSDSNNVSAYLSSDPERIASLPADVTAVIGTGANTSYEHAGLQLTRKRLGDFVHAVELSRNLNSRIQNAQVAVILYHAAAVSLFGFLLPQFLPLRLPLAVPLICSLAAIYLASRFR